MTKCSWEVRGRGGREHPLPHTCLSQRYWVATLLPNHMIFRGLKASWGRAKAKLAAGDLSSKVTGLLTQTMEHLLHPTKRRNTKHSLPPGLLHLPVCVMPVFLLSSPTPANLMIMALPASPGGSEVSVSCWYCCQPLSGSAAVIAFFGSWGKWLPGAHSSAVFEGGRKKRAAPHKTWYFQP